MRVFVISENVPHGTHDRPDVTAVGIIVHELMRELALLGHHLTLQVIFNVHHRELSPTDEEREDLASLRHDGIQIVEPLHRRMYEMAPASALMRVRRVAGIAVGRPVVERTYPSVRLRSLIAERARDARADVILPIIAPEGVGAASGPRRAAPVVAYHGDIDFMPGLARTRAPELFAPPRSDPIRAVARRAREAVWLREFELAHMAIVRDVDVIANIHANNARFYARNGHPRSVYVRNIWRASPPPSAPLDVPYRVRPVRIVGHAGMLGNTGSTFGLRMLLEEVVPALRSALVGIDHQVEVIGGGRIAPALEPLLHQPNVVVRGYVTDLDEALRGAAAFLLLNNVGPYQAAFTRHLVAWSLGALLIAHRNSKNALPEIADGENALLGSTGREIAEHIRNVVHDPARAVRIREAGRVTFERDFGPAVVAVRVDAELRAARMLPRWRTSTPG